jgi:hypothetical protein
MKSLLGISKPTISKSEDKLPMQQRSNLKLIKLLDKWQVVVGEANKFSQFDFHIIEPACDFLMGYGVQDEAIDTAIIYMIHMQHDTAEFNPDGSLKQTSSSKTGIASNY